MHDHDLRLIADPDLLAICDPTVLYHLLEPHRAYLRAYGCTLPKRCGSRLPLAAIASALQHGGAVGFPLDLAEALHAIMDVGVRMAESRLQQALRDAGIDPQRLSPGAVMPWDLAARLWLVDPDRVRRLQVEATIPAMQALVCWRCDPEDRPQCCWREAEGRLVGWAQDLDEILAAHHCPTGTRIWMWPEEDVVAIAIRHGAAVRRGSIQYGTERQRGRFFQPAVTDHLCYDPWEGELGIATAQPSRWLCDALRSTCSAWLFQEPHLFCHPRIDQVSPVVADALGTDLIRIQVRAIAAMAAGR